VACALDLLHKPAPVGSLLRKLSPVRLHRDFTSETLFVPIGWEKLVADTKQVTNVDNLPVLVHMRGGERSVHHEVSLWGREPSSDLSTPPEGLDNNANPAADVWRLGLLAFEVYCGVAW
jgi:hypothetical protein